MSRAQRRRSSALRPGLRAAGERHTHQGQRFDERKMDFNIDIVFLKKINGATVLNARRRGRQSE